MDSNMLATFEDCQRLCGEFNVRCLNQAQYDSKLARNFEDLGIVDEGGQGTLRLLYTKCLTKGYALKQTKIDPTSPLHGMTMLEQLEYHLDQVSLSSQHMPASPADVLLTPVETTVVADNTTDPTSVTSITVCQISHYIPGENLKAATRENNLSLEEVKRLALQMLPGFYKLQDLDIVHRDIKPDNVLVHSILGTPHICDFDASMEVGTVARIEWGTFRYQDYQILKATSQGIPCPADVSQDVWSFGVMLYELHMPAETHPVYGKRYFYYKQLWEEERYKEVVEALSKHNGRVQWGNRRRHLPSWFVEVVEGCLKLQAKQRLTWDRILKILTTQQDLKQRLDTAQNIEVRERMDDLLGRYQKLQPAESRKSEILASCSNSQLYSTIDSANSRPPSPASSSCSDASNVSDPASTDSGGSSEPCDNIDCGSNTDSASRTKSGHTCDLAVAKCQLPDTLAAGLTPTSRHPSSGRQHDAEVLSLESEVIVESKASGGCSQSSQSTTGRPGATSDGGCSATSQSNSNARGADKQSLPPSNLKPAAALASSVIHSIHANLAADHLKPAAAAAAPVHSNMQSTAHTETPPRKEQQPHHDAKQARNAQQSCNSGSGTKLQHDGHGTMPATSTQLAKHATNSNNLEGCHHHKPAKQHRKRPARNARKPTSKTPAEYCPKPKSDFTEADVQQARAYVTSLLMWVETRQCMQLKRS